MNAPDALHFALAAYRRRTNKITLDDIVGSVRFGVRRRSKKNGGSVGNPYRMPIDLRVPAPRDGRPISADGCTAFHFRMSVVRKGGGGTSGQMEQGTDTSKGGDGGSASNPAVAHERYIVDEWERALERTAGIEDYLDDGIEEEQGRAVFVTSNIGQTLADREAFWKDLWGRERTAAPPTIEFDLDRCGEAEWRRFITDPHAPQAVQDLAAKGLAGNLEMPTQRPGRLGVLWALHEKHPIFLVGRDAAQQSYERNFFGVKGREPTTFASTIPQSISRAQSTAGAKPVISVPSSQVSEAVVTSSAVPDHHVVLPSIQTKTEPVQPPRPVAKPSSDNKAKPAPSDAVGEAPAVMAREAPEKSGPALYETAAYVGVAVTSSYVPGHLTESSSTTNRSTVSATVDAGPSRPTSTTTVEQKDRAEKGGDAGGLGAITPTRLPAPQSEESGPTVEQPRRLSPVRAETEAAQVDPIIVRPQEEATPAQAGSATTTNLPPPSDNGPGARSPSAAGVQSTAVPTNDVPVIQGKRWIEKTPASTGRTVTCSFGTRRSWLADGQRNCLSSNLVMTS